jgi:hypothetical protein
MLLAWKCLSHAACKLSCRLAGLSCYLARGSDSVLHSNANVLVIYTHKPHVLVLDGPTKHLKYSRLSDDIDSRR